jgi:hypothetical protein
MIAKSHTFTPAICGKPARSSVAGHRAVPRQISEFLRPRRIDLSARRRTEWRWPDDGRRGGF